MNYSLYPDILPAHTKNPFQNDFFIKEEINNDDVLPKVSFGKFLFTSYIIQFNIFF